MSKRKELPGDEVWEQLRVRLKHLEIFILRAQCAAEMSSDRSRNEIRVALCKLNESECPITADAILQLIAEKLGYATPLGDTPCL